MGHSAHAVQRIPAPNDTLKALCTLIAQKPARLARAVPCPPVKWASRWLDVGDRPQACKYNAVVSSEGVSKIFLNEAKISSRIGRCVAANTPQPMPLMRVEAFSPRQGQQRFVLLLRAGTHPSQSNRSRSTLNTPSRFPAIDITNGPFDVIAQSPTATHETRDIVCRPASAPHPQVHRPSTSLYNHPKPPVSAPKHQVGRSCLHSLRCA